MKIIYPNFDPTLDQFIIRFVSDKLRSERVVRLENGYPTTEREAKAFDDRQEEALQKIAEVKMNNFILKA